MSFEEVRVNLTKDEIDLIMAMSQFHTVETNGQLKQLNDQIHNHEFIEKELKFNIELSLTIRRKMLAAQEVCKVFNIKSEAIHESRYKPRKSNDRIECRAT